MADDKKSLEDELASAIAAAEKKPADLARWERVEALLEEHERPADVAELFMRALGKKLEPTLLAELGERGVRFFETWFGDDSKELASFLERVLVVSPSAEWAFERLTVAYTVTERFAELLDAYDHAIAGADQTSRRMRLLEEAAQVAKDFAAAPDRAIGYMLKLHVLDPDNATLGVGLERLLERQERWEDLVTLWQSRLSLQSPKQARELRLRIASTCLDRLGRHADALVQARQVLTELPDHEPAFELLERVLGSEAAGANERREALTHLRQRFIDTRKPAEVVRVLELGLQYAHDGERRAILRELVERLSSLDEDARAMRHQAALLVLEPTRTERDALRALCDRTRDHALYADTLIASANACVDPDMAAELRLEAARIAHEQLDREAQAIELYQSVLAAAASPERVQEAGRRVLPLLEQAGREQALLPLLSRLAELEHDDAAKSALLGKLARLSERMGDGGAAEQAWQARLSHDAEDLEALEALIKAAAEQQAYARLCELLEQRLRAKGAEGRRRPDLVWLASTQADRLGDANAAIEVWRRIEKAFGADAESVAALTELLARAERWPELAEVLGQAAAREVGRFTELQTRLGDAYRERLSKPELAAERYRAALQVEPRDEAALRGQHALASDERCAAVAVASLVDAYERTDQPAKLLGLTDLRLALEGGDAGKAKVLRQAAILHEQRGSDPRAALASLQRAFAHAPEDRSTEREIRRLAEKLDAWDAVVAAYRETIARIGGKTARVAELRHDEGEVLERHMDDPAAAFSAYVEAAEIAPERAELVEPVVRLGGELGRFDASATLFLANAARSAKLDTGLLAALEKAGARSKGWDVLAAELGARIDGANLSPRLTRELHVRVALWHKKLRKDVGAAELALRRAVAAEPTHLETLRGLAELQREVPSEALCETLLKLADLERDNLDPLLDVVEIGEALGLERGLRTARMQRLYEGAADLLRAGREAKGQASAALCVRTALDRLVSAHVEGGEPARAVSLLLAASALPLDAELRREDLHHAARLCSEAVGDDARAIALYRDLLQTEPKDRLALDALATLYTRADRLPELLALRRHELTLETDRGKLLALRLEVVRLLSELDGRGGREQVLEENLRAQPGHAPSVEAYRVLLRGQNRLEKLATLLRAQARSIARTGEATRAAELLLEAARVHERELSAVEPAMECYRELHDLDPGSDASAALARLHAARGEHALAAKWLELRLGTVPPDTRAATAVELAHALLEAGDKARARSCLEQALSENPTLVEARSLLSGLYRGAGAFEPLAVLLADGALRQTDPSRTLALLREAADLYCDTLGAPERAVDVLESACKLAPDDKELSSRLADAFTAARRYDRAKAVFQRLIEGFGRRRSPERAELHFRLAKVSRAAGDVPGAFEELEAASKMDLTHVAAMHMLAELAQEQGDLDRAERAYRGLLMLVRRQRAGELSAVGPSEVFYALSLLATQRGQAEPARELLESAMEAASQSDAEAVRFQARLRARGDATLLVRLLDLRMGLASDPALQAQILAGRAEVLSDLLQDPEGALKALLDAIERTPRDEALHERARGLAAATSSLDRYIERVSALADQAGRQRDEQGGEQFAWLTLRLGEAIELGLGDLDRAAGLYAKVESSGHHVAAAWLAMARVAGARGDKGEQRRVLTHIAELPPDRITDAERRLARFALAELELREPSWRAQGISTLERSLEGVTDWERPRALLRTAVTLAPDDDKLAALFERIARAARDVPMLLEHFERRAGSQGLTLAQLHEPIELALRFGEPRRAETLLERARALAERADGERSELVWVYTRLADCRRQAADVGSAIEHLERAASAADGDEAEELLRDLAALASTPGGSPEVAARTYASLLERHPTDVGLCLSLLGVYHTLGDRKRFEHAASHHASVLASVDDRAAVRNAHARFLIEVAKDEPAAVPVLKALLDESPGQGEATALLSDILTRHGMNDELADLLLAQFDRARDAQNAEAIATLSLRIASLYGDKRRDAALDVLRAGLSWVPEHRELLATLLARLGPKAEARERAEVMQALLAVEEPAAGAKLALELANTWASLDEPEQVQAALEHGLSLRPDDEALRDRLEGLYGERQQWGKLAALLEREAERLGPSQAAVARLRNAATMYRDQLSDLVGSAGALRKALAITPGDLGLLSELARNLAASGRQEEAIADVTRLLDSTGPQAPERGELSRARAELLIQVGRLDEAVADLEAAYALDARTTRGALIDALERKKTEAFTSGDPAAERATAMRLVALHDAVGDEQAAREALSAWVEQAPDDLEALRMLRQRDEAAQRWDDVIVACEKLLALEKGAERAQTAIALADACTAAGRPGAARPYLEQVRARDPNNALLRRRLRELYEQSGAHGELASILHEEAMATQDVTERVALLQRSARLYLEGGDASSALGPLGEASKLRPDDVETELLLIDIELSLGRLAEVIKRLDSSIATHKKRRSPELALMYQRMGRVSAAQGDSEEQLKWLNQAMEVDRKSSEIASELADAAMAAQSYDTAMKALRAISMMDDPKPITRAIAFLRQAQIAYTRGDPRRAQHWARKAKSLDEGSAEIDAFLAEVGG